MSEIQLWRGSMGREVAREGGREDRERRGRREEKFCLS